MKCSGKFGVTFCSRTTRSKESVNPSPRRDHGRKAFRDRLGMLALISPEGCAKETLFVSASHNPHLGTSA